MDVNYMSSLVVGGAYSLVERFYANKSWNTSMYSGVYLAAADLVGQLLTDMVPSFITNTFGLFTRAVMTGLVMYMFNYFMKSKLPMKNYLIMGGLVITDQLLRVDNAIRGFLGFHQGVPLIGGVVMGGQTYEKTEVSNSSGEDHDDASIA